MNWEKKTPTIEASSTLSTALHGFHVDIILAYTTHTPLTDQGILYKEVAFYAMYLSHSTTLPSYNNLYSHFIAYMEVPLFCNTPDTRICHLSNKEEKGTVIYYRTLETLGKKSIECFLPNS